VKEREEMGKGEEKEKMGGREGKGRKEGEEMKARVCLRSGLLVVPLLRSGPNLVKERSWKSALDRSRQLQERSRSFSNPFATSALS